MNLLAAFLAFAVSAWSTEPGVPVPSNGTLYITSPTPFINDFGKTLITLPPGTIVERIGLSGDGTMMRVRVPSFQYEVRGTGLQSYEGMIPTASIGTTQPQSSGNPQRDEYARKLLEFDGVPYLWGGSSKQGTDCSGLVYGAGLEIGLKGPGGQPLPRTAAEQQKAARVILKENLKTGDLIFVGTPAHHVIAYLGDKGTKGAPDGLIEAVEPNVTQGTLSLRSGQQDLTYGTFFPD